MRFLTAILFFTLLWHHNLIGQDSSSYEQQLWLEGMVDYRFGQKMDFYTDASYRKLFAENNEWWRVMARPSLKWGILNWLDVRGGVGVFYSDLSNRDNLLEIRPWQGFAAVWPSIKGVKLVHLVRVEQQFVYNTTNWNHVFSNRFRYQLSTKIKLTNKGKKYKIFFVPLAAEFFFREDAEQEKIIRNKGRYTLGLGYVFNREMTVDARFFFQRTLSDELNFEISDRVIRLRLRYNLFSEKEDETKH